MNVEICKIKNKQDLEILAEQYSNYYKNSVLNENWTKETALNLFLYFYEKNEDLIFCAYIDNSPVGIIMSTIKPWWDGNRLEDAEIFVSDKYRGLGIAKKLFKELFIYAKDKYNTVTFEAHTYEDENGFPLKWYEKLGFKKDNSMVIITTNIEEIINNL